MSVERLARSDDETAMALFRLLKVPRLGTARARAVLEFAKSTRTPLLDLVAHPENAQGVLTSPQIEDLRAGAQQADDEWMRLNEAGVTPLSITDARYPSSLRLALGKESPPLLFVRGNIEILSKPSLGFCGSRKATDKGLAVAQECASVAIQHGVNVVSGYAAGVDTTTHQAALAAEGTTTIVLPEGVLRFRVRRVLKEIWDWERAVVVSEFGPNAPWSVQNAMRRNTTICGLCSAVVLIEARDTGGSIEAGRTCLKLGVPLFAPVYEGIPDSASGNRTLLAEGARCLFKSKTRNTANLDPVMAVFRSQT